ncbi:MAG: amidohydrolase/deacetylase family metallohydrolase [Gemmatimonadetes bacterium]|nr:amidohydrolase/deacetylase family metallohydrolase [Gemmatimonadota bacterium]
MPPSNLEKSPGLLLRGGTVVDPSQDLNRVCDVSIRGGSISAVGDGLPVEGRRVVDVSGRYVFPGLVDLHAHICWGFTDIGLVPDDVCPSTGVTAIVDAGSSSWPSQEAFRRNVAEPSRTRVFGFSNISSVGIPTAGTPELASLRFVDVDRSVTAVAGNRDLMTGIKVRQGRHLVGDNGVEPTRLAVEAAEQLGVPVMVHVGNTPCPLGGIMDLLRPGDIITHAYHGHPHGILDDHGAVWEDVIEGRSRGILMDVGHGAGSFSFDVAKAAFERGFFPDAISTDLYTVNVNGPVFDLPTTMSKMLNLGMPLTDIVESTTSIPAAAIGRTGLGTLRPGASADVAVFVMEEGDFEFTDSHGERRTWPRRLTCEMTLLDGEIVFDREISARPSLEVNNGENA